MAVVRKKQDDKILKTLRELVCIGGNKECFDCAQKGPTYINMTIGSFVCTTCSGILRGITPPHRVKSISMATFTQEEIDFVRQNGNDACNRTWLGLWDPKRAIKQEHRDFMIDKYERKRYYLEPASPLKSLPTNGTTTTTTASSSSLVAANGNGVGGSSTNINGNSSSNNSSSSSKNGTENLVPLKTITLTPPTSLRLSRTSSNSSGGLTNGNSHTGSSTNLKFQQQFTPDDSNFFSDPPKISPPTPQKHSRDHHQRLNGSFERNQKNGLLTSTTNGNGLIPAGNKFTPDSDFVADFNNANIIVNAATAVATGQNGLKNGSNHRRLSNGFSENGNGLIPNGHRNGNGNGEVENFADFEHNTIYNAAGLPISASSRSSSALSSATPSVDRYAALKDLDDQFREIKFESDININNNNNISSSASTNGLSNGLMNGNHTNDVHQVSTANPFKTANPFQQSPQQQQQQQTLSWAIPGSTPPATTNGFYATPSSPYQNGFVHPAAMAATANLLNGNGQVGFTNAFHQHHVPSSNGTGSNGYGHIQAQVVPPYGHFGHFGNPFMAAGATTATSNSNNPFL